MRKAVILLITIIHFYKCQSQLNYSFKVPDYPVTISFPKKPNGGTLREDNNYKFDNYSAMNDIGDGRENLKVFFIAAVKYKNDSLMKDDKSKVFTTENAFKTISFSQFGGVEMQRNETTYNQNFCIEKLLKVYIKDINEYKYLKSRIFCYKNIVYYVYVMTTIGKENEPDVVDFFNSIKLE